MTNNDKKSSISSKKFSCFLCDYNTSRKSQYDRHLSTVKHKMMTNNDKKEQLVPNNFKCICGKEYKHRQGLFTHKQKCTYISPINNTIKNENLTVEKLTSLIIDVVKQNQDIIKQNNELTSKITDVCKYQNNTTITNNSNNKTFNLNVFLNETCKDAMNMSEFINSLQIEYDDFEKVGEIGFVNGISNIIIKNLKDLDITQRPLHCTDKKREVLYVKEDNVWQKEDENYTKTRKLIKKTTNKNMLLIPEFKKRYPDCGTSTSKYSDKYDILVIETMGGSGDNDYEKETRILKNIVKEVVINKVL